MNKEICICAAVKTMDGEIFRGHRHSDCMFAIATRGKLASRKPLSQGFMTSENRYVTREEGLSLQLDAGIVSADTIHGYSVTKGSKELFSEDLY